MGLFSHVVDWSVAQGGARRDVDFGGNQVRSVLTATYSSRFPPGPIR